MNNNDPLKEIEALLNKTSNGARSSKYGPCFKKFLSEHRSHKLLVFIRQISGEVLKLNGPMVYQWKDDPKVTAVQLPANYAEELKKVLAEAAKGNRDALIRFATK